MNEKILRENLIGLLDEILEGGACPHTAAKIKDIKSLVNENKEWEIIKQKNIIQ